MEKINHIQITKNFWLDEFEDPFTHEVKLDPRVPAALQKARNVICRQLFICKNGGGYRSFLTNIKAGGKPWSRHRKGLAVDCHCWGLSPKALARILKEAGFPFTLIYEKRGFVHADFRR